MERPPARDTFREMLIEFSQYFPEVYLIPAPDPRHDGHMIRIAAMKNPRWYRDLCARFPSSRRDNPGGKRTRVKRARIAALLEALSEGHRPESIYTPELEAIAASRSRKSA